MKIVLASESPFRRRALDMLGLEYEVSPSRIDEKALRDENPLELTRKIAEAKARKVASNYSDAVIVAGDAVAAKGSRIFEKPVNHAEAAEFLHELSGGEFQFITALVVLHSRTEKILSTVEILNITFRKLLDREIQDYIAKYPVPELRGSVRERRRLSIFRADRRQLQHRNGNTRGSPNAVSQRDGRERLDNESICP